MRSIQDCPVFEPSQTALKNAKELAKAMRLLRRALRNCPRCPEYGRCPLLQEFDVQLSAAIREVAEELGLY